MKHVMPVLTGSRRSALILLPLTITVVLTGFGFLLATDVPAGSHPASDIVLKVSTPSARGLAILTRRFGDISDLLYLYPATEKGETINLGFPGKLVVAPDQTPFSDLLADTAALIQVKAETGVIAKLFQSGFPAARVEDAGHHIVAVLATKKAMEPIRTGAVMREPQSQKAGQVEKPADSEQEVSADESDHVTKHLVVEKESAKATEPEKSISEKSAPKEAGQAPHMAIKKTDASHEEKTAAGEAIPVAVQAAHDAEAGTGEKPAHGEATENTGPTGTALVDALIKPLDYELNHRFWGWRPNDIIPIGDNVVNFQRGVLEISRRTAVTLAERISRTGITAAFDPDLENAMNWFMIKPNHYWFPSAESKYRDALKAFKAYRSRLAEGQAQFFNRADNIIPLLMAYEDLLGSCEENLVKNAEEDGAPVSFFKSDDYFFYTKGVVSTLSGLLKAIAHDFKDIVASRQAQEDIHHAIESCHHAMEIDPIIIVNSDASSILANHRANLAAPISHARFYLTVLIKALST